MNKLIKIMKIKIKDMFTERYVFKGIFLIIIICFTFSIIDILGSKEELHNAIVIDKHYITERKSVGSGTSINSDGTIGIVQTKEVSPEQFLLIVETNNGQIFTVKCNPEFYYYKKLGDQIQIKAYKGLLTDAIHNIKTIK